MKNEKRKLFILVDFDQTCIINNYPEVGPDIKGAVEVLMELSKKGHKLILWTCRGTDHKGLSMAKSWFRERGIPLYAIQDNPEQWTDSRKVFGDILIDDTALGTPLIYNPAISESGFVDWKGIREILVERGIL